MPYAFIDPLNTSLAFLPLLFSRNTLEHVIDPVDTTLADRSGLRYYLEILTPEFTGSTNFKRLVKMPGSEKPPATTGGLAVYEGAFYQLNELLDGFLDYQKPTFGAGEMAVISTLTMPFMAKESAENKGVDIPASTKNVASQWLLKAGLLERDFAAWGNAFFTDYMSKERPFLTWQPDGKTIGRNQPEYLYFLLNCSPLPATITRRFRVHYVNGTSEVLEAGALRGAQAYQVVSVPVHPKALNLNPDLVAYYEVWLADGNQERISQVRTYVVDQRHRSHERWLLFTNSLGGWDTLRLLGESAETLDTKRASAELERPAGAPADFAELRTIYVQGSRSLTVSTGYLEGNATAQLKYLDELLLANQVYLVDSQGHQALELTSTSLVDAEDNTDLLTRSFTFRYVNAQYNHSAMPAAPVLPARATKWRGMGIYYELDSYGKRTGYGRPLKLQKYYVDDNSTFKPLTEKPNQPGDPDYMPSSPLAGVQPGSTPFASAAIIRATSYKRTTCPNGTLGDVATINIAAGKYGSEISQAEANNRAEAEFSSLNTQAYADQYGACTAAPEMYNVMVAPGQWRYRVNDPARFEIYYYVFGTGDPIFGNKWDLQGQTNAFVYPRFSTDLAFPVKPENYLLLVYGPANTNLNLKVYVDGVLVSDTNVLTNRDGYEHIFMPIKPASGAKVYMNLTTL
ncbi:hypothetical protein GCM10028807_17470 [Spirosoma daeguense]